MGRDLERAAPGSSVSRLGVDDLESVGRCPDLCRLLRAGLWLALDAGIGSLERIDQAGGFVTYAQGVRVGDPGEFPICVPKI